MCVCVCLSSCISYGLILFFPLLEIHNPVTNTVDPDKVPHFAAFYLGLHCQSTCLVVFDKLYMF